MSETLSLFYGEHLVGQIRDAFEHQNTWFGYFEGHTEDVPDRVLDFIRFCRDWHKRLDVDPKKETDPDEFNQYQDVLNSHLWSVRKAASIQVICQAPVFSDEHDITWVF